MWCIVHVRHGVMYGSGAATRLVAITEHLWESRARPDEVESRFPLAGKLREKQKAAWAKAEAAGYRAVKVRVTIL